MPVITIKISVSSGAVMEPRQLMGRTWMKFLAHAALHCDGQEMPE
jgi:hypothetical protein